ncbi:MAG: pyridoxal-phosphate dependent enzyme [Candidatus Peribacter sp.]|nr:pyridoxal-phosphate dependent enzyme [Candidatus Peribacter sp.]
MNTPPFLPSGSQAPTPEEIRRTQKELPAELISETPLVLSRRLSDAAGSPVYIKDEGQQLVRSYKGRGSAAKMLSLSAEERARGVVCASAGNHAQGVAAACNYFHARGTVFMPTITKPQKVDATKRHGNGFVDITLVGDRYDQSAHAAHSFAGERQAVFLHPFDDWDVIRGQGTVAAEIAAQMRERRERLARVIVPVGGGGLMAGTILALQDEHPDTEVIGVEPEGAACMLASLKEGHPATLDHVDTFVDGAAVARPGDRPFETVQDAVRQGRARMMTVSNGLVCATMADLYQIEGRITEPAGALSLAALEALDAPADGATVCILSGTNFDMSRNDLVVKTAIQFRRIAAQLGIHLPDRPKALLQLLIDMDCALDGVNIAAMHYDESQSNGDPPLELTVTSQDGKPGNIQRFLNKLSSLQNDDHSPRYPFTERTGQTNH